MKLKAITIMMVSVIIGAMMIAPSLSSSSSSYAITNSTSNINKPLYRQIQDVFENPFFDPDYSCLFDTYQLHCIPGENQECPEGFGNNEDDTCFAQTKINGTWEWECPDGYHSIESDETGQCYPDTEPCYPGQVRNQTDPNDSSCKDERIVCDERNYNRTGCVIKADWPDANCLASPGLEKCNIIEGFGCPDEFVTVYHQNFTSAKCVPEDRSEHIHEERYRQVYDPNRCAIGYELYVPSNTNIWRTGENPIGSCNKKD